MRQLTLSEVDEAWLLLAAFRLGVLRQLVDDLAEIRQALIDFAELLQALALGIRVVDLLAARQVDDVEATCADHLLAVFMNGSRLDEGSEYGVRARADQVHTRRSHMPVMLSVLDHA